MFRLFRLRRPISSLTPSGRFFSPKERCLRLLVLAVLLGLVLAGFWWNGARQRDALSPARPEDATTITGAGSAHG